MVLEPQGSAQTEISLEDFIGQEVFETTSGLLGTLIPVRSGVTKQIVGYKIGGQELPRGAQILLPDRSLYRVSGSLDPKRPKFYSAVPTGKASEGDLERWFGGAGGAAPAYSGTQAAQAAAFAHDTEMANLQAQLAEAQAARDYERARDLELEILDKQQTFTAEQNRLAEEAMLKRERLDVLQNLVEGFLQSQQRASEFLLELQPDPFRFAAAAQGMPVMGTTPQAGYAGALQEFTQRPAPTLDPNAPLSAIESGISTIMGQQLPLQPGLFGGMSGGGTVPMGASGTFLVGEGGPEVMEVTPYGVTVKPLSGGFQYGGGVDFDVSSIMAGLAPLYASLGFESIPTVRRGPAGEIYGTGWPGVETFRRLGVTPKLVRDTSTSHLFLIEDGTHRYFGPEAWAASGFQRGDIVNLTHEDILRLAPTRGAPVTEAPALDLGPVGPMGPMPFPIIEPTTEALLPAPFKIAPERRRLFGANPQLYDIGTYAYNFPNSPIMPGALRTAEEIYTPRGMARGPIGLR